MKAFLQQLLLKVTPDLYYALKSLRFFRYCKERFEALQNRVFTALYSHQEIHVLSGPFKGLKYFNHIVWGSITPKWIGSYEEELHSIVEEIREKKYTHIINVGAAEGFYAVGLSRLCPDTQIVSYDVDPIARFRQSELVKLNNIKNLHIAKYCSHEALNETLPTLNSGLVICDIEGYEHVLLNPSIVSSLKQVDLLVELHDHEALSMDQVKADLIQRFQSTHEIQTIVAQTRNIPSYLEKIPGLKSLSPADQEEALNEHRPINQEWLWMKIK